MTQHSKYCDLVYRGGECDCDGRRNECESCVNGCNGDSSNCWHLKRIASADVTVTITAPVSKLCPVKDERDNGTVTITYCTDGSAFELHDLAGYLRSFRDRHLSHEDFTHEIAEHLAAAVTSSWTTAGMTVACAK